MLHWLTDYIWLDRFPLAVLLSFSGAVFVASLLYFFAGNKKRRGSSSRRGSFESETRQHTPTDSDAAPTRSSTPMFFRRKITKNKKTFIEKFIYSRILPRKKSASLNELPHLLTRRHTVFPLQAAKDSWKRLLSKHLNKATVRAQLPKPPSEFFEPSANPEIPDDLKPLFYVRHHIKLLELPPDCNIKEADIEILSFDADRPVALPGDDDNSMYVVLEGSLAVFINPPEGKPRMVKQIEAGNCFFSFLSIIDILMHNPSKLRTVSLWTTKKRAKLAKYNFLHFRDSFKQNPEAWIRPIQIIITRLVHVNLMTLNGYLGLGEELLKNRIMDSMQENRDNRARQTITGGPLFRMNTGGGKNKLRPRLRRLASDQEGLEELSATGIQLMSDALQLSRDEANSLLKTRLRVITLEEGQTLFEQGHPGGPALAMVISGVLQVSQSQLHDYHKDGTPLHEDYIDDAERSDGWNVFVHARELIGGSSGLHLLHSLCNEPAIFTMRAVSLTAIAVVEPHELEEIVRQKPSVILPIAYSVLRRMSPFFRAVDFAIDWVFLESGQTVYREGDSAESLFVVLSGRLRSVSNRVAIEEFGRGDVLGMIEVLQKNPRNTTILAIRYSQLARIPEGLLNYVKMQFPQVGFRLVQMLGRYYSERFSPTTAMAPTPHHSSTDPMAHKNLHTIAIFPASLDVPLVPFTCELVHALSSSVGVLRLSSAKVAESLGDTCLEKQADFGLMHWLNAQEDLYSLVIYECDYTVTNWTRRCLRQADAILVVANGEEKPPEEHFIDEHLKVNQDGIRSRKELVLLWDEQVKSPRGTFEWLKGSWFSGHYHIRAPERMYQWHSKIGKNEAEVLDYYQNEVFTMAIDVHSDFSRLGRILSGNAVGLVLGGGGAKGAAHIGVIRALREHGIPVDIVGGTSIGSLIGGLFAEDPEGDFDKRARSWFMTMTSLWKKIWDLTYAHSAMFTGAGFNRTLQDLFGTKCIEDLWLPYFCITTDLTESEMRVHRSGPLWMYSRASMSLAGYLPPLCDPMDGHLLLDGGYVNNLPAEVMRSVGAKAVIAVDVGSTCEMNLYNYGDSLSGFWVLMGKLNPWAEPRRILGMEEIQSRLAFVTCHRQLEQVKKANYCNYLRPPIDIFQTLDFAKFDIISDIGHRYADDRLPDLIRNTTSIRAVVNPEKLRSLMYASSRRETSRSLHNSFTELAAQISRIPSKQHSSLVDIHALTDGEDYDYTDSEDEEDFSTSGFDEDMKSSANATLTNGFIGNSPRCGTPTTFSLS